MNRYKDNLKVEGDKVYSYNTHVATIDGNKLYRLGWWSVTTSKHINYVAKEYGLTVQDMPKDKKPVKEEGNGQLKAVSMVCAFGALLCDTQEEKNKWNKRMLSTVQGIDFPEDFDNLPEEEKQKRLNGALEFIK